MGGVCLYEEQHEQTKTMKNRLLLSLPLIALSLTSTFAQQPAPGETTFSQRAQAASKALAVEEVKLTKFNLDFPGGTPRQLIGAIEKAMGKPVNAIIPTEHADVKLPPLKMANVDVRQLFQTLELTSQKTEAYVTGTTYGGGAYGSQNNYQQMRTSYGFRTSGGNASDDSIWYFYVEKPNMPLLVPTVVPKLCRFYPLTSYLDRGLTVDDITTAIQTGWKMLGDKETPTISFHKETKLLIAVGEPAKLETIDAVLKALAPPPERTQGRRGPTTGNSSQPPTKAAEETKTEN